MHCLAMLQLKTWLNCDILLRNESDTRDLDIISLVIPGKAYENSREEQGLAFVRKTRKQREC
jgi:hypothetical protein